MARTELKKHTINLFAGDYEEVQAANPECGAGLVIRTLVRNYLERIQQGDKIPVIGEGVNL